MQNIAEQAEGSKTMARREQQDERTGIERKVAEAVMKEKETEITV